MLVKSKNISISEERDQRGESPGASDSRNLVIIVFNYRKH